MFKRYNLIIFLSIWFGLSEQIVLSETLDSFLDNNNESYIGLENQKKKNILRQDFFGKYKNSYLNYIDKSDKDKFTSSAFNDLILSREFDIPKFESKKKYFMVKPLIREVAQKPEIKLSEKSYPEKRKPSQKSKFKSDYIIPPKIAPQEKIHPFTTNLILNGVPVSHLSEWEFYTGTTFGDNINTSFSGSGIFKIDGQVTESLTRDNIYTVDQKASYLQLQTVRESRQVTITSNEPQTLMGMQMQMSLTASCLLGEDSDDKKCTYTPGLSTDRNSIDPDFLVPTRIFQTANMGDVVTPESLAFMKLPGFQMGANGQQVGIDLYLPNTGAIPGNTQGNKISYDRKEEIENTQLGLYSQVRQIVKANHNKAVIGRTVRGFGLIADNDNLLLNSAIQLGNFLLPDVNPRLEGGVKKVNTSINKNLFLAANNVRIPTSSFTFYHAGIGYADSPKPNIKLRSQIPKANFNSIWIGISPVIERKIERIVRYKPTGEQRILSDAGGEGGSESNISLLSVANGERFSTNGLQDFYAQIYLTNYLQDVNFVNGNRFVEDIKYYPHISFTGNVISSLDAYKYYGGLITGKTIKAYIGGDYTRKTSNGFTISTGGIGYINSDRDYYSQLFGSISQGIHLSKQTNLVLSSSFNYALDRENRIGEIESEAPASLLTLGARANFGNISLGLVNYFDDILPNSVDNTLLLDLGINFSNNFRLSAYYTPINETSTRSRYGATAKLRLGKKYNSPTVSISWKNNDYDLGQDTDGSTISFTDNIFKVLFRFGEPASPFEKANKQYSRQQTNGIIDKLQRGRRQPNPVSK